MSIPSDVSCISCRIRRDSVGTYGIPDGDGLGGLRKSVVRDRDGYVYVATIPGPEITLFEPTGRVLRRIGRAGEGPGEFRDVTKLLVDTRGNLHVFDRRLARHTIFRQNGNLVSATGLPVSGFGDVALLQGESIVLNSGAFDRDNAGYALLRVDKHGEVTRRADEVTGVRLQQWVMDRVLHSGAATNRLIVAPANAFVIDVYDANMDRTQRLERKATWFKGVAADGVGPSDGLFNVPPTSRVLAAWEGDRGVIWVAAVVADPQWEPRERPSGRVTPGSPLFARPRFVTVIEAIDPASGRVLARDQSRDRLEFYDGHAWQALEQPDGSLRFVCWRLRLER